MNNYLSTKKYKITIESDSYTPVFETYAKFRFFLANNENSVSKPNTIKTKKSYTLLKSPHVNKKSREQYQTNNYKKSFEFRTINPKLVFQLIQKINKEEKNRVSITITCLTSNSN